MSTTILSDDPRFAIASRTRNRRFPSSAADVAGCVEYCVSPEDVATALQKTIDVGLRPTVRCSGHCYEDFVVNNPKGAILDLSMLNRVSSEPNGSGPYTILPGTMLGHVYEDLYRLGGVAIPGGTCYTVTAGGHISGGGYGTLARLHGLTVDWLTAVNILTVDDHGKVIARRTDKHNDPDLFRALRGGQASNFGIVTGFEFEQLPLMPQEMIQAGISWDWKDMTPEKFVKILQTYGQWMVENDKKKDSWGLFGALYITNHQTGNIHIGLNYTVPEGPVRDLSVLMDFFDHFQPCKPASLDPDKGHAVRSHHRGEKIVGDTVCYGERTVRRSAWLEATLGEQTGSPIIRQESHRAKYKSSYMKKNFTEEEALAYYKAFTSDATRNMLVAIDAYGGATNNFDRIADTSISQRSSVMKLQFQSYWNDQADDAFCLKGMDECYKAVYSTSVADQTHLGTPYPNDRYEGCYINYPDVDMLRYDYWPQLYYGTGDLYPFLQDVKKKYDPHNIFHHAMSIRA